MVLSVAKLADQKNFLIIVIIGLYIEYENKSIMDDVFISSVSRKLFKDIRE